ncbi:hypothetical protein D3C85_1217680 [compost metagenome]
MTQQRRSAQHAVDTAEQGRQQILHPTQPAKAHALAHLHQQQPRLVRLQGQVKYLAVADGGPTQPAGQPAIELPHLRQIQPSRLDQALEQPLIAGLRRVTQARWKMLGGAFVTVDPRFGLPAQIDRPAHLGAFLQRTAQGIGAGGQGHTFALQAQPAVQSNGGQGHLGSASLGKHAVQLSESCPL